MQYDFNAVRLASGRQFPGGSHPLMECLNNMWPLPYEIPKKVALDTGDEFFSVAYSEEFTRLGISPNYKPKGPRFFLVEEMIGPARTAPLGIREKNPQWAMGRVLVDVIKVVKNTLGASGFSPNRAVFGHGISGAASAILVKGDRRKNGDVLRDLSTRGRFIQAPELRGVVTF